MARQNKRKLQLSFKRLGKGQTRGRCFTSIGGKAQYFGYGDGVSDTASYMKIEAKNQNVRSTSCLPMIPSRTPRRHSTSHSMKFCIFAGASVILRVPI